MNFESESRPAGWPAYSEVTLSVVSNTLLPEGFPQEITVPRSLIGGEYNALPKAEFLARDDMRHLISFGSCGLEGRICLDVDTSEVVHVPALSQPDVNPVNGSLELFSLCVEVVIGHFPFYGEEEGDPENIAARLGVELNAIDSIAQSHNGFWETFLDDLAIGDYSTEEVLGSY